MKVLPEKLLPSRCSLYEIEIGELFQLSGNDMDGELYMRLLDLDHHNHDEVFVCDMRTGHTRTFGRGFRVTPRRYKLVEDGL